jgi:hypothetical protein
METTQKQFLTRAELAQFLTSRGYPIAKSTLDKLCNLLAAMVRPWLSVGLVVLSTSRPSG